MSKLTDTLKAAMAKKQGKHHLENDDGPKDDKATKKRTTPPSVASKPMKKAAGRGR